jgi:hypothetical protein
MADIPKSKRVTKKAIVRQMKNVGASNKEIAKQVYPDQPYKQASVAISKALKDYNVKSWVAEGFDGLDGLDIRTLIKQYREELTATKDLYFKGDFIKEVPDYTIRQRARETLLRLMQAFTPVEVSTEVPLKIPVDNQGAATVIDTTAKAAMLEAIERGDIKAIERIVFKDGD